jgi:dipeptidyl aminopeptidase/acylaminoacyl peptidase
MGDNKERSESCPYINVVEKENELSAWMFVSTDATGKVLVNTVQKGKILTTATKHVLMDPVEDEEIRRRRIVLLGENEDEVEGGPNDSNGKESIYSAVSCRFGSSMHPSKKKINDKVTLVAIGNFNKVLIFAVMSNNSQVIFEIDKPIYKPEFNSKPEEYKTMTDVLPTITWGYGSSPLFKD